MPLYCPGELITVGHQKYSEVHKDFIQNRERLRRQHEFPVLFGHVDGLSELFAARRRDPAYILFGVKRGGAKKKNVQKSSETENLCLSKNFCFFRKLVGCDIFRIDLSNLSAWVDLKIHHSACQSCSDSYLTSGISELKNLVLEIPIAGPPIIDFK